MKKITLVVTLLWITLPKSLFAESAGASSSTETSPQVVTSTTAIPERGMTEPTRDIFITLTRSAFPTDRLPTTADIITPQMIQQMDAQNAGEAIARQTSVQTLPTGQLGSIITARIRGSSSQQTLLLVDGRPYEGVALGTPDLSEIPVESIDHIEILRGGASALYGPNAIGGVINVITKRATYPGKPISHVSYESASYGAQTYRLNFASRYGPLDYLFYGDQKWISGFRDNSDARTHNIGGNAGISMGAAGKLLFDVSGYHSNAGIPGIACGPMDPFCMNFPLVELSPNQFNNKDEKLASSPTARQTTDTNYLRTSYILPLPANALMTLRLFGQQREVAFEDANDPNPFNATRTDRQEQSKGGEAQFNLPYGFLVGGSFIHDREDNADRLTPTNSFIRSIENWGVFAQEEFHWQQLTLIPSGRYDHNSQVGETKNPRVQLIEDATPWLRFSGSAGRSFRAPTIDDLFLQIGGLFPFTGNPSLRPEKAWVYDAGFEIHQDSFSFRATYFRANVTDLIQIKPITFDTVVNIGEARRQGAELQLNHTLNEYFRDSLNYTYLENRGIPSGFDHLVVLAFSPRHTVNYTATVMPTKRWKWDVTGRYEDSRYAGNDLTGEKLGSQLIVDTRVSYQLRQLELFIGVNDLNDKRYEEQPGFPLPGRTYFGGVSLRLWE